MGSMQQLVCIIVFGFGLVLGAEDGMTGVAKETSELLKNIADTGGMGHSIMQVRNCLFCQYVY